MCDDAGHAAVLCLGSNLAADVTDGADRVAGLCSHIQPEALLWFSLVWRLN